MAEKDGTPAAAEQGDEDEAPKRRRWPGKKQVLFIVLPLVLVVAAGAGVMFSGLLGGSDDETAAAEAGDEGEPEVPREVVFYDLPEMLVNLNSGGRQSAFLKIQVSLELGDPDVIPQIEAVLPRIVDNFQVYLRELRPEELGGTKGVVRLKEELLVRVNAAVDPIKVYDILFKEILVQS